MIGFGLTFAAAAAPVLVTEVAYPTQRAPATSLYNSFWYATHPNPNIAPLIFHHDAPLRFLGSIV